MPLLLIVLAGLSAGVVAYGTYPGWAQYPHGLEFILWARRLQWPLVALSLIACVLLMGLAISGRRRAWWLLGLAPVLALFAHRFALGPAAGRMTVAENPAYLAPDAAGIPDSEWVVGVALGDRLFAYPYSRLYSTPVVIQDDHDKRIMLMWSAYANRVLAVGVRREVVGRDIEVVSTPANALLLYDSRRGQFINGLTGQTMNHQKPIGFSNASPLRTWKMPWKAWRALHPETQVMAAAPGAAGSPAPREPILPAWPLPPMKLDHPAQMRVVMSGAARPAVAESDALGALPLNCRADGVPTVMFRPTPDSPARAFDRRVLDSKGKLELIASFGQNHSPRQHPAAFMIDQNSNTGWDASGVCVDAPADVKQMKGEHLEPVALDDGLYWGVIRFWYPDAKIQTPAPEPIVMEPPPGKPEPATHSRRRRPHRKHTGASGRAIPARPR